MSTLEQRLHALGRELEYPPEPDVAPTVLARLEHRRPFPWRTLALAFAVVVLGIAAAFAVPQARTAILRWFHISGATVERVETLPPAVERSQAGGLGRPRSREAAERELGFRLALPPLEGDGPKRVYVLEHALGTVVLRDHGRTVLLSEYQATDYDLMKKGVAGRTLIEPVRVRGERGLWLQGPPHTLTYPTRSGEIHEKTVLIRGNVLLWTHDDLTLRLEGRISKAQALRLAAQID
jgi:hypothetical protein